MIGALVFDFDGLILDTETPLVDAWIEMHARAGLDYSRGEALRLVGHVDLDYDPWKAFPPSMDRARLESEHRTLSRAMLQQQVLLPGVQDRLQEARALGLKLAVASNSSHAWVDRHLQRLGLHEFFNVIRCRDDVARGKPEPEIYRAVLTALALDGTQAIAFEDSHPGSLAAKRAGLWCVAVPNACTTEHDFSHTDLRVPSLAAVSLTELIARWGGK